MIGQLLQECLVDIDFVALQLKTTSADFAGNNETSFYEAKFATDLDLQDI